VKADLLQYRCFASLHIRDNVSLHLFLMIYLTYSFLILMLSLISSLVLSLDLVLSLILILSTSSPYPSMPVLTHSPAVFGVSSRTLQSAKD
jgi:hypothetical protein